MSKTRVRVTSVAVAVTALFAAVTPLPARASNPYSGNHAALAPLRGNNPDDPSAKVSTVVEVLLISAVRGVLTGFQLGGTSLDEKALQIISRATRAPATLDPSWLSGLPDCPCTVLEARNDPMQRWRQVKNGGIPLAFFHPGAKTEFRALGPNSDHGQQCSYDSERPSGALITGGRGAGTPDVVSPLRSTTRHFRDDVLPGLSLPWQETQKRWIPNRGEAPGCPTNVVTGTRLDSLFDLMSGALSTLLSS